MPLTPLIAIHMTAALAATASGPLALWARKGSTQRLYLGACVVAGVFTLAPDRYLGQLVLGQWPGVV